MSYLVLAVTTLYRDRGQSTAAIVLALCCADGTHVVAAHTRMRRPKGRAIFKSIMCLYLGSFMTPVEASPEIPSIISTYMYTNTPISSYIVFYYVVWRGTVVFTSYNISRNFGIAMLSFFAPHMVRGYIYFEKKIHIY